MLTYISEFIIYLIRALRDALSKKIKWLTENFVHGKEIRMFIYKRVFFSELHFASCWHLLLNENFLTTWQKRFDLCPLNRLKCELKNSRKSYYLYYVHTFLLFTFAFIHHWAQLFPLIRPNPFVYIRSWFSIALTRVRHKLFDWYSLVLAYLMCTGPCIVLITEE